MNQPSSSYESGTTKHKKALPTEISKGLVKNFAEKLTQRA